MSSIQNNHEDFTEVLKEAYDHLNNGRFKMALVDALKAYGIKKDDPDVVISMAWAMLENGYTLQALEYANIAVELNPGKVNSRFYRGYLLMRMGIFEGAVSDFDWVIQNKQTEFIPVAYYHKARALAGLERYFEGLEEVDQGLALEHSPNPETISLRYFFRKSLGYSEGLINTLLGKKNSLLEDAVEALNKKEYWFTLWASKEIIKNQHQRANHPKAEILRLEALLGMFQLRLALKFADEKKSELKEDVEFQNVYRRILKLKEQRSKTFEFNDENEEDYLLKRTDTEVYQNDKFSLYHCKTYDLLENLKSGKREFLLQFDEKSIKFIGVEIVIENPFYKKKGLEINGVAKWFLNNKEAGENKFNVPINKDWKLVEFVQSWGTEDEGFWKKGQGRVDIFLEGIRVCSTYFLIGDKAVSGSKQEPAVKNNSRRNTAILTPTSPIHEDGEVIENLESLEELLEQLNSMVGLNQVKQSMKDFVDYLNFNNERKKYGIKTDENISFHCVFLGNPGTGKTTVARLLGKIFRAMGLLSKGQLVEVDRTSLVGQFIGETAQKTEAVINDAVGGLLFIDEAYTLKKEGSAQDFGQEAIDVLLKRMEDKKGEFIVIAAGYPEEMNTLIGSNPGLKSRFPHFFNFEDFNPDELLVIFRKLSGAEDYHLDDDAAELLKKEFTNLYRKRDKSFGNARLVKNYFNELKLQISRRCLKLPQAERTKEALTTIKKEDIESVLSSGKNKIFAIGIDDEHLNRSLEKLNALKGLENVKKEINEIVKLARYYIEQGEDPQNKFSSHLVFSGSPGTGKTTVARLFSEIYSALGILPKGHLVEADRQQLVGTFVGETADKTKKIIDKAIGGTLFIDEAYTLVKKGDAGGSDFGQESIDTLLKRMEDDRGKFIVIAAGYTDLMNDFLNSNPGLQSRFTKKIVFEDYLPVELFEIAESLFVEKGYLLDESITPMLKDYFNKLYSERNKTFGNARLVRNFVEAALKNHLLRIADISQENRTSDIVKTINSDDIESIIKAVDTSVKKQQSNQVLADQYFSELMQLPGLDDVKKTAEKLINSLKVAKLREERGLSVIPKNLNSIFVGNPGTGKKAVAGLLGKIYKELGMLDKGNVIEADRASLITPYQGQSAAKTEELLNNSIGSILIINDFPSFFKNSYDSGKEVLEVLDKRLEDLQGKIVVVLSGNYNDMLTLIENKPGIKHRFANLFYFEDLNPRQLLEVALNITKKNGYRLDEGAWQHLLDILSEIHERKSDNFTNSRVVQNILFRAISNQEERILTLLSPNDDDLSTVLYEDIAKIELDDIS